MGAFADEVRPGGTLPFFTENGQRINVYPTFNDYFHEVKDDIFYIEMDGIKHFDIVLQNSQDIVERTEVILFQCKSYKRNDLYNAQM